MQSVSGNCRFYQTVSAKTSDYKVAKLSAKPRCHFPESGMFAERKTINSYNFLPI